MMFSAIFAQQRFNLTRPPLPLEGVPRDLGTRSISYQSRPLDLPFSPALKARLPNPDTPDNHIIFNDFGIGPIAPITRNSSEVSSRHLVPGSSNLLKRVAWPPEFRCTPENGSVGPPLLSTPLYYH